MAIERNESIRSIQTRLIAAGLLTDKSGADGIWGPASEAAFQKLLGNAGTPVDKGYDICWSAKVSPEFVTKVKKIAQMLQMPAGGADDLMACMAWESGESFAPDKRNGAGSGATGLIQFMPATALPYFNSAADIAKMDGATKKAKGIEATNRLAALTAEQQLDFVYKYFEPYAGKLQNLGDLYMAILWPKGIGKTDDYVLWDSTTAPTTYRQNMGLDVNKDGNITRGECVIKVREKYNKGMQLPNRRPLV